MKNIIIWFIMICSSLLIIWAMFVDGPYEAKLYVAVTGLVGIVSSVLLTIVEDYWR
jgi:hypothetical protein